jgi:hypothetical protein
VNAVVRQVRYAFRAGEGGAYGGGDATYRVEVATDGFSLQPRHHPLSAPASSPGDERPAARKAVEGALARFGGARLSRGGARLSDVTRVAVAQDGSLERAGSAYTEVLRSSEEGVEQRWHFPSAPAGKGDLTVRLSVTGVAFAGATGGGLHFRDEKTGLGVRYGHATWVDANGRRTALEARWKGGAIVLRVPEALLASSAYPAVLDPVISPEQSVDTPVLGPNTAPQQNPSVASNGTGYLVAWYDLRGESAVYATRVALDGTVLDPTGIVLSNTTRSLLWPEVASNGSDYLVVWPQSGGSTDYDIHGTRVAADGTVLDPGGLAISTATGPQLSPSVGSDGTGYLVVWTDGRGGTPDLYGTRVRADGAVLDPAGLAVCVHPGGQQYPSVGSSGGGYLVAWGDGRNGNLDIYGTRVGSDGTVLDPSGLVLARAAGHQEAPSVAAHGAGYLVAWRDLRNGGGSDVYATRVGTDGTVLDPSGLALSTAIGDQDGPTAVSNGAGSFVVWRDTRTASRFQIYGTRVGADGTVLDPSGLALSSAQSTPVFVSLASSGSSHLLVWTDDRGQTDIYAARVTADGVVQDPAGLLLSASANNQHGASVASNGTGSLVVWTDDRHGTGDIYAVRLSAGGAVLDPAGLLLSSRPVSAHDASVASNGSGYLVAWTEDSAGFTTYQDIYATRVSADGAILDPASLALSTAPGDQFGPSVGSDGTGYLVAWQDFRTGNLTDIYATRVGADGTVHDPAGLPVSTAPRRESQPSVASNGSGYLVAWTDERGGNRDIYAARVSAAGVVQDSSGLVVSAEASHEDRPSVASNGSAYLVAWTDFRGGGASGTDIYARRVSAAGVENPGLPLSTAPGDQAWPTVTSRGSDYLVAWMDRRGGSRDELYATRVAADGTVRHPSGLALASESTSVSVPRLAAIGDRTLVVYYRFDPAPGLRAHRVRTRLLTNGIPVVMPRSATTREDTPLGLTLPATDPDGDALTYVLDTQPSHGSLSGTPPHLTYTPAPDYAGPDAFTFTATDSWGDSASAMVSVAVEPVDDPPVAGARTLTTARDTALSITLSGIDVDGDVLTYRVESEPAHGTLAGTAPDLQYTPARGYVGEDAFTFSVSDGRATSPPATVQLTVTPGCGCGAGGGPGGSLLLGLALLGLWRRGRTTGFRR